ncbi:MAG: translation initiation factor IF-2 [Patescibacteria group bacterium]|nr:translation initiation factor IF-2 [Patescibacteria group bacterium]
MTKENENLITRPPVVVILGHIDSGKTSLLDQIRKTKVTEKESGGITQHIGAYQVRKNNKKITFIDTPGHEAFSQMRSRGAKIADIAVLVIDSTKGVQVQTKEAIEHIKNSKVSLIIAFNKMDRPEADPQKAKGQLEKQGIIVESLGGKVPSVNVSAKTGQGIEDLLDIILLIAEMEELKADNSKPAQGVIIESYLDNKRGPIATLLLSQGILKPGNIIATPSTTGKIKSLEDFQGDQILQAAAADPAVVLGLDQAPRVGETFKVFENLKQAEAYIKTPEKGGVEKRVELQEGQKALNLIIKTDVLGSIEAIQNILKQLPQEKIVLKVLKSDVGQINENDIQFAKSGNALVLGFRVKANSTANRLAEKEKIRIMNFEIIYDLVEEIRKYMEKILEPEVVRNNLGKLKVLVGFWGEKKRQIVGGRMTEGEITKSVLIEVTRNGEVIDQGRLINLQKNKKDIEKGSKGDEVGILYEGEKKIEKGDELIIFKKERKKGEL